MSGAVKRKADSKASAPSAVNVAAAAVNGGDDSGFPRKSGPSNPWGFDEKGARFKVPDTLNTAEIFFPQNLAIGSCISALCVLGTAALLFCGFSKWLHIGIFFFWRLSYDFGLGVILRAQSEHKTFLKLYLKYYGDGTSWMAKQLDSLASAQLPKKERDSTPITSYPQVFRAWLVYKNLVNIILVNDGLSYIMLGIKCFHFPPAEGFTLLVCAQYLLGLALALFNWWAKVDAHRCIGEYCWYWGDFFFRKDLDLTFDGIFELFPHPMYTVGYSLYYGYSLIARSYTMLFVSLVAHGCQLAFLFFVEEPHIKRTYGSPPPLDKTKLAVLYDPKSGWFPDKSDNVFLLHFDLFRSGDFSVFFFSLYAIAIAFLPADPWWAVAQVVLWRFIHWIGLGAVLWGQSSWQLWTHHFTSRGRTTYEAFGHWKNTYNLSLTMNQVVFIACALRFADLSLASFLSAFNLACCALGLVLIALSVWSYSCTYEAVGEFGWFYGDFFISETSFKQHLCYTGIYRFLNNPDCVTGYAGHYGLALIAQSWPIFLLALASHILNILFLNLVEIPHMNKLYSKKEMRGEAPFPKALKRLQQTVGLELPPTIKKAHSSIEKNLTKEVHKIRSKALEEAFEVYKKIVDSRNASKAAAATAAASASAVASPSAPKPKSAKAADEVVLSTPERISIGDNLVVRFSAPVVPREQADDSARPRAAKLGISKSSYDWVGVFPIDTLSGPGTSEGRWVYVEPSLDGSVVFPSTMLPAVDGVYEARYHRNNGYLAVASKPFIIADEPDRTSPSSSPVAASDEE